MPCNRNLRNRAHSHGISSDTAEELVLGRSFVGRARAGNIYPILKQESKLCGLVVSELAQLAVVRAGHILKPWAELIKVLAYQRIGQH